MTQGFFIALVGLIVAGFVTYFGWSWFRKERLRRVAAQPLAPEHIAILQRMVPAYSRMPESLRREFVGDVNVFLHDKQFFGCDGLEITDEMRITIAGNACLLLLNREANNFPGFRTILVYPDTYVATEVEYEGNLVIEGESFRAGESWHAGPLVLSWADVKRGIEHPEDGQNVVIHEFAHKLDEQNSMGEGLPILQSSDDYAAWADVMTREFDDFLERVEKRKNRVIDEYGATSPAEFFAVATESFFESGALMKDRLPDLYAQLEKFYGVDPAGWRSERRSGPA